jgi:hypothetical protein
VQIRHRAAYPVVEQSIGCFELGVIRLDARKRSRRFGKSDIVGGNYRMLLRYFTRNSADERAVALRRQSDLEVGCAREPLDTLRTIDSSRAVNTIQSKVFEYELISLGMRDYQLTALLPARATHFKNIGVIGSEVQ